MMKIRWTERIAKKEVLRRAEEKRNNTHTLTIRGCRFIGTF
jgi:predicted transcriptional regulator